jgi:hypothetical protein
MMPFEIREGAMVMLEVKPIPNLLGPRSPKPTAPVFSSRCIFAATRTASTAWANT